VTHAYADGAASATITVALVDEDGLHAAAGTLGVTVLNVAPTLVLAGAATVDEGGVYTLTLGPVTDPGADTVVEWIRGLGRRHDGRVRRGGDVTHAYADGAATATITVALVDEDGLHSAAGTLGVTVVNVAPTSCSRVRRPSTRVASTR